MTDKIHSGTRFGTFFIKAFNSPVVSVVLLAVLAGTGPANAHDKATGVVKQRMDAMGMLAGSMKAIAGQVKSPSPDPDAISVAAQALRDHAGDAMLEGFPEGSLQDPTEARPKIWKEWERFSELAERLALQGQGLILAAANPPSGAAPESSTPHDLESYATLPVDELFLLTAKTCSACHQDYRVKK
ncbi:c-type cytochrome [Neptunicoccus cionae]|uniref:c-type cytochrome n=1 Tax=Neptunicoccus cionae TaxID=2035344 RepID=UPI0015E087B2|nr:cytochrome c [Amylibacter cionae]